MIRGAYAETPAGQVHARIVEGDAPAILFLHQTATSARSYLPLLAALDVPNRLIALDTPGFGESFEAKGAPDLADYAGWIVDAADSLGVGAFHVFGHHTGANLAIEIAARWPDRVRSAMLLGPAFTDADERAAFAEAFAEPIRPRRDGSHLLENWRYAADHNPSCDAELIHGEVTAMLRAWRARPQAYGAVARHDAASVARTLRLPALLLTAPGDYFHDAVDRARALLPHAVVAEVGGDNFSPGADPVGVARAIGRFLAAQPG